MHDEKEMRERTKESKETPVPVSVTDIGYRRPEPGCLRPEVFFSPEYDAIDLAIAVTAGDRKDRRLWRKYLNNGSIPEDVFRECAFAQWRENLADGEPDNSAACLQMKLKPHLKGIVQ